MFTSARFNSPRVLIGSFRWRYQQTDRHKQNVYLVQQCFDGKRYYSSKCVFLDF